jgi:putative oxidoreductase
MRDPFAFEFIEQRREYGALFLRLLIGIFIIWGVQDNILSHERMLEFEKFLAAKGTPSPAFAAQLSVYAQFICGISILLGAFIRLTSAVFIMNFIAAILIAHRGDTFRNMLPALMMLASGLFFLFHGAGKPSVDEWLASRRAKSRVA